METWTAAKTVAAQDFFFFKPGQRRSPRLPGEGALTCLTKKKYRSISLHFYAQHTFRTLQLLFPSFMEQQLFCRTD